MKDGAEGGKRRRLLFNCHLFKNWEVKILTEIFVF